MPSTTRIREKREEAQHLIAISETPSYPILKEIVEKKIDRTMRQFVAQPSVTAQELDWARGFMFGMRSVLEVIERGPKVLEQAIKAAQALEGAEEA